jgi:hypothetical protein
MIDLRTSDCRPAAGHIVHTYLTALRYGTTVTASEATPPRLDCTATIAWGSMPDGSGAEKAVGAGPPGPAYVRRLRPWRGPRAVQHSFRNIGAPR